jgi:hypothetical protein
VSVEKGFFHQVTGAHVHGTFLAHSGHRMEYYCQHCNSLATGSAYRVTSEQDGVMLLDLIVCYECCLDARRLGLNAEQIVLRDNPDVQHERDAMRSKSISPWGDYDYLLRTVMEWADAD